MSHLTSDSLFQLAQTIVDDLPFTDTEADAMEHVRVCDECYKRLVSISAILRATSTEGMAEAAFSLHRLYAKQQMQTIFHCSSRTVGERVTGIIKQTEDMIDTWRFVPPLALSVSRSAASDYLSLPYEDPSTNTNQLEAPESEKTFILFEPDDNRLVIQIDTENLPHTFQSAKIQFQDGIIVPITFTHYGALLHAIIQPLAGDEFDLILTFQE